MHMSWLPWSAPSRNPASVRRPPASCGARSYRPSLEVLEDRLVLTIEPLSMFVGTAALSGLSQAVSADLGSAAGNVRHTVLTYARGLQAHVFAPANVNPATSRLPALAFFFGGGLSVGSPSFWFPAAAFFAERGFVAISFQYRLGGAAGAAASVSDARTALRWMRTFYPQLGINPNAITAVGVSAGGYLALMTALGGNQPDEMYLGAPVVPNSIIAVAPIVASSPTFSIPPSLSVVDLAAGQRLPPTLILQGNEDALAATPFPVTLGFAAHRPDTLLVPFPGLNHATVATGDNFAIDLLVMSRFLGE
jgi:acetyl esterase/lipase